MKICDRKGIRARKNKKVTKFRKYGELQCLYATNEAGKEREAYNKAKLLEAIIN